MVLAVALRASAFAKASSDMMAGTASHKKSPREGISGAVPSTGLSL